MKLSWCERGFARGLFSAPVQGLLSDLFDWLPEGWEHVRRCSDGLLADMVGFEGKVARGRGRVSFGPVPRLVSHLFRWLLGEWEHVRRGSDDLVWAPFGRGRVRRQG